MQARKTLRWLGLAGIAAGIALIASSLATGEGHLYLLLIVPVFTSTGALGLLGIVVGFAGIALALFSFSSPGIPASEAPAASPPPAGVAPPAAPAAPPYGGVVMLGPIPIVFGSSTRIAKWMLLLGIALAALVVAAFLLSARGLTGP